jgi:hypothetical protein
MTNQEINAASKLHAEQMVNVIVSQAGLVLSTAERQLVILQAQHLYLKGMEDGIQLGKSIMRGGENPNAQSQ